MSKIRLHYFQNREETYKPWYSRHHWHWYRTFADGSEVGLGEFHLELMNARPRRRNIFSARFHVGNMGSETPWDGHFLLFGIGFFWSHTFFRKFAAWWTRCSGYSYDTREYRLSIDDWRLRWEFANHSDMCTKNGIRWGGKKRRRRLNTWREGHIRLNPIEIIWGPKRYTYTTLHEFAAQINLPEDSYPVILKIQEVKFGRTRVNKAKHAISYCVDVDAPLGIPTHVDHSGGFKGDRTYGWGLDFGTPDSAAFVPRSEAEYQMELDAVTAVWRWVVDYRKKTGFVKPDPVGS